MACSMPMDEIQRLVALSSGVSSPHMVSSWIGRLSHRPGKSMEGFILVQTPDECQRIARLLRHRLIAPFPFTGRTQKANLTALIDHEEIFERVPLLLATVIFFLLRRIFGTLDSSFSTIMQTRGEV